MEDIALFTTIFHLGGRARNLDDLWGDLDFSCGRTGERMKVLQEGLSEWKKIDPLKNQFFVKKLSQLDWIMVIWAIFGHLGGLEGLCWF